MIVYNDHVSQSKEDSMLILFILYTFSQFFVGRLLFRKLFDEVPKLLEIVGSFLMGVCVTVPMTYVLSCFFSLFIKEPIFFAMIMVLFMSCGLTGFWLRIGQKTINNKQNMFSVYSLLSDIALVLFSLAFSSWIMIKTFRGGEGGQLFVGGNTVFDFGQTLGIIRSFSWGANIPISSPFFSGAPFFYHFFFQFWIALWEYFGVPLVWAVNIPSVFSFAALLITVYYLPQVVGKQGKLVGWLAVILTITHSTLTFWYLLIRKGLSVQFITDLWQMPTYPFAGPFDGSIISIFTTLNPYVNQRHLGFSIALGLFCLILGVQMIEKKQPMIWKSVFLGFCTGLLFLFNMSVSFFVGLCMIFMYILRKKWKDGLFFVIAGFCSVLLIFIPFFFHMTDVVAFIRLFYNSGLPSYTNSTVMWTLVQYLWNNMGILPVIALIGLLVAPKKSRYFFWSVITLFLITCIFAAVGKRGFDQKFYSFSIIGINVLAAIGLGWLYRKGAVLRIIMVILFFILIVSGVVDLCALKNEFAYPLVSKDMVPLMTWIQSETPKNAIFVSYADMIDPVVLAGRKNFFGFFGNVGSTDRSTVVKNIYLGDIKTARNMNISYILVPKWNKNDFPYFVDTMYFKEHRMVVYEDEKFTVYQVASSKFVK